MAGSGGAEVTLATVAAAARGVRARRPSRVVPLLVSAVVILGALPFYLLPSPTSSGAGVVAGVVGGSLWWPLTGMVGTRAGNWAAVYWLGALPVGYALLTWWYRRAAARTGVVISVRPLVLIGLGLLALLLVLPFEVLLPGDLVLRGLTPILTIAVGVLAWALAERSLGLLAVAVVFLAAAVGASLYDPANVLDRVGWYVPEALDLWPNLIGCALVLLVGATGFAVREHRARA